MTPPIFRFAALSLILALLNSSNLFLSSLHCAEIKRLEWSMDEPYNGRFPESFNKLRWEVPNIIRQTTIDIAVRLGLDFREGWSCPMVVRFVDSAPTGVENVLAYVQFSVDEEGRFQQSLNVNLTAYEREAFNFNQVFAHEIVHAMVNDALGPEGMHSLPVWFHEGLAVYGAGNGDAVVDTYVMRYANDRDDFILNGLEGPHGALDYAEDYLAVKYIYERHGVNSLHNFVREIVRRKGDIPGALDYTCFENWSDFQKNVRTYALEKITRIKNEKRFRGSMGKPF